MAYTFRVDQPLPDEIRRCATEQLERAREALGEDIATDPASAVHTARKAIKKERSLLRTVRGSMPRKQRRRENRALRASARGLSSVRDATAMIATLDHLASRYAGQLPEAAFAGAREHLRGLGDAQRRGLDVLALGERTSGELSRIAARVEGWKLRGGDWGALEPGLRRTYRDGRRAMAEARKHSAPEVRHAWRKRVKDLWYQQRLLATVAGPAVAGYSKDAHELADLLGDDHDLVVLSEALSGGTVEAPVDVDAVLALIEHRRAQLQSEALHLGARVYAEKPKAYIRRLRRSWRAGRDHARAQAGRHPSALADATRAVRHS